VLRTKLVHLVRNVTRRWRAPNSEGSVLYDSREHATPSLTGELLSQIICKSIRYTLVYLCLDLWLKMIYIRSTSSVQGSSLVRTIRVTQLVRLYQHRCIYNAIKPVDTRHPGDGISRLPATKAPQKKFHDVPLRAKAGRQWKADDPELARSAHSGAEELSIVLSTAKGMPRRIIAARQWTH
jgi:hypothetical protein